MTDEVKAYKRLMIDLGRSVTHTSIMAEKQQFDREIEKIKEGFRIGWNLPQPYGRRPPS